MLCEKSNIDVNWLLFFSDTYEKIMTRLVIYGEYLNISSNYFRNYFPLNEVIKSCSIIRKRLIEYPLMSLVFGIYDFLFYHHDSW